MTVSRACMDAFYRDHKVNAIGGKTGFAIRRKKDDKLLCTRRKWDGVCRYARDLQVSKALKLRGGEGAKA